MEQLRRRALAGIRILDFTWVVADGCSIRPGYASS